MAASLLRLVLGSALMLCLVTFCSAQFDVGFGWNYGGYVGQPYGYQNGGYQNGGYQNGGYQNGGYQNGGYQNGGYQNGGYQNGGYQYGGRPSYYG